MTWNIEVLTAGVPIRPLAKNILRAVALQACCKVSFCAAEGDLVWAPDTGERYPCTKELLEAVRAMTPDSPADAMVDVYRQFLYWLEDNVGRTARQAVELAPLLREVRRQSLFHLASEDAGAFEAFWRRWDEFYPRPQRFEIVGSSAINETNEGEAEDYLAAHQKADDGVPSIDNAIASFLNVLPRDVETVLDIGSGPGYVNRNLPPDLSVLAMDISKEILRGNLRQTCVGDIMDIPLADGSVDMVMACDMLEHLPDDVLAKGMAELERVSRKYLYLQVPFQEDPVMAMAYCPACRNVWHVNHHKRFFDQQRLTDLVSGAWRPVCVNYTGDVSLRRKELLEAAVAHRLGWNMYCVEGAVCPNCGGKSANVGQGERQVLRRLADFDADRPFPAYTEIGVLFCRVDQQPDTGWPARQTGFDRLRRACNVLQPSSEVRPRQVYTATEMTPGLYLQGCTMEAEQDAFRFARQDQAETAWFAVSFPALARHYTALEVTGAMPGGPGNVSVALLDAEGREFYVCEWEWGETPTTCRLEGQWEYAPVYVKIYFKAQNVTLYHCRLAGDEDVPCWFYPGGQSGFLRFEKDGVRYALLMPAEGLALSHEPEHWLQLTGETHRRQENALQRFVQAVCPAPQDERAAECPPDAEPREAPEKDARALIVDSLLATELQEAPGPLPQGDAPQPLPPGDARTLIIDSLVVESAAAFSGDVPRGVSPSQVPWDGRKIIIDSLFVEAIMGICEGGRPSRIRQKAFAALRNGKRRLHGWLRRHSRLYELLISMGLKELYFKIKRRIKL